LSQPRFKIIVDKGPCAGAELALRDGIVTIGRDPRADLVLSGDQFVSGEHAKIVSDHDRAVLYNLSPNGTLVNGGPATDLPLAAGDLVSMGVVHVLSVRTVSRAPVDKPAGPVGAVAQRDAGRDLAPSTRAEPKASARDESPARPAGRRMPIWLIVYLALMGTVLVGLAAMRVLGSDTGLTLTQLHEQEVQYARARDLAEPDTRRVLALLDTAAVHERRGDRRSAYEVYREVLGVRQPIEPQSPAYRYATSRMAALGPK
jgi:pSer/pThr/pTyr-binding forkhead associated (FHA) protein